MTEATIRPELIVQSLAVYLQHLFDMLRARNIPIEESPYRELYIAVMKQLEERYVGPMPMGLRQEDPVGCGAPTCLHRESLDDFLRDSARLELQLSGLSSAEIMHLKQQTKHLRAAKWEAITGRTSFRLTKWSPPAEKPPLREWSERRITADGAIQEFRAGFPQLESAAASAIPSDRVKREAFEEPDQYGLQYRTRSKRRPR